MVPAPPEVLEAARALDVPLEGALGARLGAYLHALLTANQAFNLTAITDPQDAWAKHALDSLTLVPLLRPLPAGARVVDVGSGGGLPGIPLALALPSLEFTLLEATAKKARFLEETARDLGLDNLRVHNDRAESFGRGDGRERYDAATSRALSRLPVLLELTLPLLREGGSSFAIKGEQAEREVSEAAHALDVLHGRVDEVRRTGTGTIVIVRKLAATPARYPRRPGEPKRAPL